jgi:predicted nucleic acid-binding protein
LKLLYVESSAILKLFKLEAETSAVSDFLAQVEGPLLTSELSQLEVIGNLQKFGIETNLARSLFRTMLLIPVESHIIQSASDAMLLGVGALDSIHLATARALSEDLEGFVTYDLRLAGAVSSAGIPVISPGKN